MKHVVAEALGRLGRHRLFKTAAKALTGDVGAAPPPLPSHLGPPLDNLRVLLLGTCGLELFARSTEGFSITVEHMLTSSFSHSPAPDVAERPRDVAVVALTLRHILAEASGGSNVSARP